MDDVSRTWLGIIICAVLVVMMCFLTACENSLAEMKDSEAEKLSQKGYRGKVLGKLLGEPSRLITSGLILRILLAMSVSAAAEVTFARVFANAMGGELWALLLASFIILCAAVMIVCTIGIVLPKRLCAAGKIGSRFAYNTCFLFSIILKIILPLELLVSLITGLILKMFGVRRVDYEDTVTEEEILMMVDAVNETGGIEESQAEMINNIFEFDDLEVHEIMTHRTEVSAADIGCTLAQAAEIVIEKGYSRLPVYEGSIDRIIGAVFAKDLLRAAMNGEPSSAPIRELIREIKYIPENFRCDELLEDFISQKTQIAVVVDEYGGTAGIVTMEDLLEEIVGSIQDEYDNETPEIDEITPNTFDISGRAMLPDVMEELGCNMPENREHDTIGGFVTELIGHIPGEGEDVSARWENVEFTVIRAGGKSIEKLRAVIDRKEKESI
ncbi:MAG: HlyC/CorC family transporter [Ruminococcus sp.]|nr:HlyC/CorC family transporter [Ruminococcus sp.]